MQKCLVPTVPAGENDTEFKSRSARYHFIGIAGAGMSGLARVLAAKGANIAGSELVDSETRRALEHELGVRIPIGHRAGNVGDPTLVVASAAVSEDNPEIKEARRRGIPVASRAEMLGKVMDLYPERIAISGTHGKTTTSAMTAVILQAAGLDPTALIGGEVLDWGTNAIVGAGDQLVAEACEAFGSFLELHPTISVVTNVEADHLDHYGSFEDLVKSFETFVATTSRCVILCHEDPRTTRLRRATKASVRTFGFSPAAGIRAKQTGLPTENTFEVWKNEDFLGEITLALPGRHNIMNALAAVTVGLELGVPFDRCASALAAFTGTGRRFETLGTTANGITVVDDYAHHPTEIKSTLAAARARFPGRRIIAVFQPHLPSRTKDLMDEFARSFGDADVIVLTDIYLAREAPLPGIDGSLLAENTRKGPCFAPVHYIADKAALPAALATFAWSGDVILTMGAGDIRSAGERFLEAPA